MKIDYVADLHADFWVRFNTNQQKYQKEIKEFLKGTIPQEKSKYLILAGDIANTNVVSKWVIEEYADHYEKVFIVFGNHDYYLDSKTQKNKYNKDSKQRKKELVDFINENEKVVLMENFEIHEIEGKKIAGDTNWYDTKKEEVKKETQSNDWTEILRLDIKNLHDKAKIEYEKMPNVDLVVTHIPPVIYPHYKEIEVMAVYYNELDLTLGKTKKWVSGHMHDEDTFNDSGITFYVNSLGYPKTSYSNKMKREKEAETKKIKTLVI